MKNVLTRFTSECNFYLLPVAAICSCVAIDYHFGRRCSTWTAYSSWDHMLICTYRKTNTKKTLVAVTRLQQLNLCMIKMTIIGSVENLINSKSSLSTNILRYELGLHLSLNSIRSLQPKILHWNVGHFRG